MRTHAPDAANAPQMLVMPVADHPAAAARTSAATAVEGARMRVHWSGGLVQQFGRARRMKVRAYPPADAVCARDRKARMLHRAPAAPCHPQLSVCKTTSAVDSPRKKHCLATGTCSASSLTA